METSGHKGFNEVQSWVVMVELAEKFVVVSSVGEIVWMTDVLCVFGDTGRMHFYFDGSFAIDVDFTEHDWFSNTSVETMQNVQEGFGLKINNEK